MAHSVILKISKKHKNVNFLIFSGILKSLIMVGFKIPSKNTKNKKTLFLKKLHLQCVFYNLQNYVLSQLESFFYVFLDCELPSTSNTDFCVFFQKFSFPLWKKVHKIHFSRDFLHSSITVRFWNYRNYVLTAFEEKNTTFWTSIVGICRAKRGFVPCFLEGRYDSVFEKWLFYTRESYSGKC